MSGVAARGDAKSCSQVNKRHWVFLAVAALLAGGFATSWAVSQLGTSPGRRGPTVHGIRVVREYAHDPLAFTQGLMWMGGSLYESTGMYGETDVREVRLEDGGVVRSVKMPRRDFGEGLVHVGGGELLQLLWKTGRGNRLVAEPGERGHLRLAEKPRDTFTTPLQDGWGLEFDGESLLVTDSGPMVYFLDPKDFSHQRNITVTDGGVAVDMINELELIDGQLWANVYGKDCLARINTETGAVEGWVLLQGMFDRAAADRDAREGGRALPSVFNGIAWVPESRRLLVTGKRWPTLFEIELAESDVGLARARKLCVPKRNIFHGPWR